MVNIIFYANSRRSSNNNNNNYFVRRELFILYNVHESIFPVYGGKTKIAEISISSCKIRTGALALLFHRLLAKNTWVSFNRCNIADYMNVNYKSTVTTLPIYVARTKNGDELLRNLQRTRLIFAWRYFLVRLLKCPRVLIVQKLCGCFLIEHKPSMVNAYPSTQTEDKRLRWLRGKFTRITYKQDINGRRKGNT